ncbi:MAG: hypothetical protein HY673_06135, partial [Chloroflexi bacterium]|nr:hypothetical protein [Chloroflexota bacterium]
IRPDVALDEARRAVTEWRFERILHGRKARFDPATEFVILAWDVFRAVQFRADEGRRLAISVGVELDKELMKRKFLVDTPSGSGGSRFLALQTPAQRQRKKPSQVDMEAESFESTIDAVHAAMRVYERDGSASLARWIEARGLARNELFVAAIEALLTSIPPRREEFQILKAMVLAVRELQDRIDLKQLQLAFQNGSFDEQEPVEEEAEEEEDDK